MALLGELKTVEGGCFFEEGVSVAYVSQRPWILNATLRDNILFGLPFDEDQYWRAIDVCALRSDLALMPGGDRTEIGEKVC